MSPRAAVRLEALGFPRVYDYAAGKMDWLARNLPRDGEASEIATAGDLARDDVATCGLEDRVGEVAKAIESSPYGFALALGEQRIVLGRVRRSRISDADPDLTVADVLEEGPSTVRAYLPAERLVERLRDRDLRFAIVTDPEGRLFGVFRRADAEGARAS